MLTDKDIDKLMKVFATKDEVRSIVQDELTEFKGLVGLTRQTLLAVEGLASRMDAQHLENAARDAQLSRHDGWIHKIAKKAEVELKD